MTLIVASLQRGAEATIQGLEKMRWLSIAEIANKLVVTLVGIVVLLLGYRVVTFAAVVLAGASLALVIDVVALVTSACDGRASRGCSRTCCCAAACPSSSPEP